MEKYHLGLKPQTLPVRDCLHVRVTLLRAEKKNNLQYIPVQGQVSDETGSGFKMSKLPIPSFHYYFYRPKFNHFFYLYRISHPDWGTSVRLITYLYTVSILLIGNRGVV